MKYEEAIEIITNCIQRDGMTREQDMALAIAQNSLGKRIPRRTIVNVVNGIHHCPDCHDVIPEIFKPPFCSRCGQKLDWSDTK